MIKLLFESRELVCVLTRVETYCRAFTNRRVSEIQRFEGGLSNSNFKIHFESCDEPVVLRIYERDPAACQREIELLSQLSAVVPVPQVLHAETGDGPFAFLRYVEGITFRELKSKGSNEATQQAAYSVGKTLAAIGQTNIADLQDVLNVPTFETIDLASPTLLRRVGENVTRRLSKIAAKWTQRLESLQSETRLVHGDFRKQNILVRPGNGDWEVAAILDWELAFAGSPLRDVGLFLRYEHRDNPIAEPAFSNGFRDGGGELPDEWFALSRVLDLESLCRSLNEPDLPADIETELVALVMRSARELESAWR
jgi:aminoglycoside phosphotransferase (APT) family kinase protein